MIDKPATIPTVAMLRAYRKEILALAERYHAYNVRIFGSVARGDATSESDLDFLVSFRDGASLYDLSGLVIELSDLLGRRVDVADDKTGNQRFLQRALKDAVLL